MKLTSSLSLVPEGTAWHTRMLAWRRHPFTMVLTTFVVSMALCLLMLFWLGIRPTDALKTLWRGAFGSLPALADTLVFASPRLLVALGAMVALRCGIFNLGGEGQLQMGAIGAVLPATLLPASLGYLLLPFSLLGAALFGAFWALIPAVMRLWRGANEIIVTLMMNFIAVYLVKYLVQGPLQPPNSDFNMSAKIAHDSALPILLAGTRLHAGVPIAFASALACWFLLYHTAWGVRVRAAGLSPRAARLQRLPLTRLILGAMLISGGLGGLAGAGEVLGVQYRLIDGFSNNIGFDGLAIALLGGLMPMGIVLVALYFGALNSGALALQMTWSVPSAISEIMTSMPIVILAAVQGYLLLKGRPLWNSTQ